MKRKNLFLILVIIIVLTACTSGTPDDINKQTGDTTEKTPDEEVAVMYDNEFARNLVDGRWMGELILEFYDGGVDYFLTKNYIHINLDATFSPIDNSLSDLNMVGHMDFTYETPVVTRLPEDTISIDFTPEKNQYSGPYNAKVGGVSRYESYGLPAHVNFLDIAQITGGVTVTQVADTNPPYVVVTSYGPKEGATFANDLYMLRQMGFITLTPESDNRVVFGPHDHLKPSLTGIEDNIHGYMERVVVVERNEPLTKGERIETSSREILKARIQNSYCEMDLQIEPNTSLEYGKSDEELLEIFRGKILSKTHNLSFEQLMKVTLPQAVIGVRGTEFYINVINEDKAIIRTYSGEVEVTVEDEIFALSENQGLLIMKNIDLIQLFEFDSDEMPDWWIE